MSYSGGVIIHNEKLYQIGGAFSIGLLFVNAAAALNYGGYGDIQGYKPAAKENPVIYLSGKEHSASAKV